MSMSPESFCYWLQGYFELAKYPNDMDYQQVQIVQDHLALVFNKVTPTRTLDPKAVDEIMAGLPTHTGITINPEFIGTPVWPQDCDIPTPTFCEKIVDDYDYEGIDPLGPIGPNDPPVSC